MVNHDNYRKVKAYLEHLREVKQLSTGSVERYWSYLKHLLLWADETPLSRASTIRPTFGNHLSSVERAEDDQPLAAATLKKIVQTSKRLFTWLLMTYPREFRKFPRLWIDELRPPRSVRRRPPEHQFVTLDQVRKLVALDPGTDLAIQRDQAAAAMMFLSGVRSSALASLPIEAVDLEAWSVRQWPGLGVRTKNGKAATTYLLPIPDLREIVQRWDAIVRPQLPRSAAWYTSLVSRWGDQILSSEPPGKNRHQAVYKRMRKLFDAAGLPYQSPHKFRHGHAVYALQHSDTMADYKAVSMNLMHSDIRVTDSIYARLASDEVRQRIAGLTSPVTSPAAYRAADLLDSLSNAELAHLLSVAAERLAG